jgi:hypothetical protein
LFLIIGFVCGYACGWDLILWVGSPVWVLGFRGGCAMSGFWVVMGLRVWWLWVWVCRREFVVDQFWLWVCGGYGLWILLVVVMGCAFCVAVGLVAFRLVLL